MGPLRRKILRVAGALGIGVTSGCLRLVEEATPDEDRAESTTTDSGAENRKTTNSIGTADVRWDGTVVEDSSTSNPATVELRLTNVSDRSVVAGFGPTPPFSKPLPTSTERRVPLLFDPEMGPNGETPTERDGDCWTAQTAEIGIYDVRRQMQLGPNETVTNTYVLLARTDDDRSQGGCFADGTYEYTDEVALGANETGEMELSFEIVVEEGAVAELTTETPTIR